MANPRYRGTTPKENPSLFDRVPFDKVKKGDIFQGRKNKSKWYRNVRPSEAERKYTYYRLKKGAVDTGAQRRPVTGTNKKPVKPIKPPKPLKVKQVTITPVFTRKLQGLIQRALIVKSNG